MSLCSVYRHSPLSHCFEHAGNVGRVLDDGVFKAIQSGAILGRELYKSDDRLSAAAETCENVAGYAGDIRDGIGLFVLLPVSLESFFSGKMFSTEGERDWKSVAIDILVLAARLLSPFVWLHSMRAIDLGKHAKGIGGATMGLLGVVVTLDFGTSILNLNDELNKGNDQPAICEKFFNTIQTGLDWIALPFDFGLGNGYPPLAITGGVLNLLSATWLIVKEGLTYGV